MTIYILDNDPVKCAQSLDDKSLNKMIKDIAQVLCNVHRKIEFDKHYMYVTNIPLKPTDWDSKWSQWARECRANYLYLVDLLETCLGEYSFRKLPCKFYFKFFNITIWARDNCPFKEEP